MMNFEEIGELLGIDGGVRQQLEEHRRLRFPATGRKPEFRG